MGKFSGIIAKLREVVRELEELDGRSGKLGKPDKSVELGPVPGFVPVSIEAFPDWPLATPENRVASSASLRRYRALQVVAQGIRPSVGVDVLDVGCGDGFVSQELALAAGSVVGFDLREFPEWVSFENPRKNLSFVTSRPSGPFDLVVLHDVVDHVGSLDAAVELLSWVGSVLKPGGLVYCFCHPWSARHGADQWFVLNRAFAQLLLPLERLRDLGLQTDRWLVVRPQASYSELFRRSGFKIERQQLLSDSVEPFFDRFLDRMAANYWRGMSDLETLRKILGISGITYFLRRL